MNLIINIPPAELKEWILLIKDALLGVAALVTTVIAIYGARMWKRELAGKEIYIATKSLVKESHLLSCIPSAPVGQNDCTSSKQIGLKVG